MKLAILGAAGKAGSAIGKQALAQGHDLTAVVRPASRARLQFECPVLEKDVMDLTAEDLRGFDAVIDALGSHGPGTEQEHIDTMRHLISVFKDLPSVRLLVVGGAGSLYADEYGQTLAVDSIPEAWQGVPKAMAKAFAELKESGIRWTYFSPAFTFDPKGRRTGKYILGTDYLIPNSLGESYISYADYAIAMIDEVERGNFIGQRFTAVSDTSAIEREASTNLFSLSGGSPFTRRGSYFGVYSRAAGFSRGGMSYATAALEIATRRGATAFRPNGSLFRIIPTYKGHNVPYAVRTTATELTLVTLNGKIRFCFANPNLMLIKGEGGMGLKLERDMTAHEIMKKRGEKAWEESLIYICDMILNPLKGGLEMDAPYDWEALCTPRVRGACVPDENGEFLLAMEEFTSSGFVRDSYPTWEEAKAAVTAEWEGFLANIPHFDRAFEERREEAAYTLWSYLVDASGLIKRPLIFMTGNAVASSWQMCQNAVALNRDIDLAVELLLNMIDDASPTGQLPDFYDDMHGAHMMYKPPLQGWALKWIMKTHDLGKEVARDKLETMYTGFVRWADWFMKYRDDNHNGIPAYEHGDESGFDDTSIFQSSPIVETPDLCAYLALTYEALGDLGKLLGKPEAETDRLYAEGKALISRMIEAFWTGERFIARNPLNNEVVATDSALYYMPIVLGKRLPQEIIDKLASDLSVEGELLTGYGIASERLTGDGFRTFGMARGAVLPPVNLLILTGLYDAGKEELAKKIAQRYCRTMKDGGFNMIVNPLQGNFGGFGCSWPACAYIILADMYSNM